MSLLLISLLTCRRGLSDRPRLANQHTQTRHTFFRPPFLWVGPVQNHFLSVNYRSPKEPGWSTCPLRCGRLHIKKRNDSALSDNTGGKKTCVSHQRVAHSLIAVCHSNLGDTLMATRLVSSSQVEGVTKSRETCRGPVVPSDSSGQWLSLIARW